MRLDKPGAADIAHFEAVYLYAYPDAGYGWNVATLGIGHTKYSGPPIPKRGDRISLPRAIALFRKAADEKYGPQVLRAIKVPLEQHEFNALVSFHFNTGAIRKGSVDDKLNRGDRRAAMRTLEMYNKSNGRVFRGLERRRASERRLFETGRYNRGRIMIKDSPNASPRYIAWENLPWDGGATVDLDLKPTPPSTPPMPERKPSGNFLIDIFNALRRLWSWLSTPTR